MMAATTTPRRSTRIPHHHTPKMSERKKGLFQSELMMSGASRESMTQHRQLTVLDSDSESDDCDLGIGALDSSSCDENDASQPATPDRDVWRGTRSHSQKLLKESQDLKNFIKSPFTLKKYQTRLSCSETKCTGSLSTPVTPHLHHDPRTPSSTHSCASAHTTSSTSSRARKSLASLIADTESCSSSLKDLNFDTDSGADSKENTPSKLRRSSRRHKMTPKLQSFKGILLEQKKNTPPMKTPFVCLTKMDMTAVMSPTQMLKTPHNTSEAQLSPPKLGPNRRSCVLIDESPESTCDSEKSHKRLNYDSKIDNGPNSKNPRLETTAPKARLSLFNSDRLKEILSTKSFYGKPNPEMNHTVTSKISNAIEVTQNYRHRLFRLAHSDRRKKPGQINRGVKHRIRKPKIHKSKLTKGMPGVNTSMVNNTASSGTMKDSSMRRQDNSMLSQDSSQELVNDKTDPFDSEKQTIDALLSQWTEEEVPESELSYKRPDVPCFNRNVIEDTSQIFEPIKAVPVPVEIPQIPTENNSVILELGTQKNLTQNTQRHIMEEQANPMAQKTQQIMEQGNLVGHKTAIARDIVMSDPGHIAKHGGVPKGDFLPVEGGYIFVADNNETEQEMLPDLDEIERELKMLDEQILQMAKTNNIDAEAVLASTQTDTCNEVPSTSEVGTTEDTQKLFSIFTNPNAGANTGSNPSTPSSKDKSKKLLKSGVDQYVIDAGQKRFGASQCTECGVIYEIGNPQDEHDHLVHHTAADVLKFNGLKDEVIVGRAGSARCIRIRGGEPGWKKVETLLDRVVHPQLGYGATLLKDRTEFYTAFLYIDKKKIVGCLIVEPKLKAHRLIPGEPDCCSVEEYPVKCGVSRIWTHVSYRRRGLASRLLDCARAAFLYGAALHKADVAFSAPTAAGKALAASYCGTNYFFVYLE